MNLITSAIPAIEPNPERNPVQDHEWAQDWQLVCAIWAGIENLRHTFKALNTTYLRQLTEKHLILNLKKYAWSLQNHIIEKYRDREE